MIMTNNDSRRDVWPRVLKNTIRERLTRVLGRQDERNVIYVRELEVYLKIKRRRSKYDDDAYLRFWRASAARAD